MNPSFVRRRNIFDTFRSVRVWTSDCKNADIYSQKSFIFGECEWPTPHKDVSKMMYKIQESL